MKMDVIGATDKNQPMTSKKKRRHELNNKLFTDVEADFKYPKYVKIISLINETNMADINAKLTELEQRAKSLQDVYDDLLQRAGELERRSRECEAEYQREKTSFDVVEILMKPDGRSKAMFDHVSLFFYVLLTKLHRKGIGIMSTTELWSRLHEKEVKAAYENTVKNLGFTQKEIKALQIILDVLHEKDLTVYVNQGKVDSSNLTQRLHDLNEEFWIEEREGYNDDDDSSISGVKTESRSTRSDSETESLDVCQRSIAHASICERDLGVDHDTAGSDDRNGDVDLKIIGQNPKDNDLCHGETCYSENNGAAMFKPGVPVSEAECGDTVSVDSLLLYLQIQRELDPLVTSALRRAVAVAHCSLAKSPRAEIDDLAVDHRHCRDEVCDGSAKEDESNAQSKEQETNNPLETDSGDVDPLETASSKPPLQLTDEIKARIPDGCGALFFSDAVTSTPKTETEITELNSSNNAIPTDDLTLVQMTAICERAQKHALNPNFGSYDLNNEIPLNKKLNFDEELSDENNNLFSDDIDLSLFYTSHKKRVRGHRKKLITSDAATSTPARLHSARKLRSFSKVKCKTTMLVEKERQCINQNIRDDEHNRDLWTPPSSTTHEHLEIDDLSESECSIFHSCHSNQYNVNEQSLHEELSELGFFSFSQSGYEPSRGLCDQEESSRDFTTGNRMGEGYGCKEHVNVFMSPLVNPYGYEFESEYYMLWPGQETEIELKDFSCDIPMDNQF